MSALQSANLAIQPVSFTYTDTASGDIVNEHELIINFGTYTVTYGIQLRHIGYKLGECIGIKSLMPGQKIRQDIGASYSKIVYDETGKQLSIADTTSSESELFSTVSNTLHNLSQTTNTSTSNWNAGGGFSVDLLICSFGGGGGGGSQDISTSFNEVLSSVVTSSSSKVKNSKTTSALSSFHSLRTTTETQTNTTVTNDIIENRSTTRIARYYFFTMYKQYDCVRYIKNISQNPFLINITSMRPLFNKTFLPHMLNQNTALQTFNRITSSIKDGETTASVALLSSLTGGNMKLDTNGLIGTNELIGESGLTGGGLTGGGLTGGGLTGGGLTGGGLTGGGLTGGGLISEGGIYSGKGIPPVSKVKLLCDFCSDTLFPSMLYITNANAVVTVKPTPCKYECSFVSNDYVMAPSLVGNDTVSIPRILFQYLLSNIISRQISTVFLPIDGFYLRGENGQTLDNK